MLALNSRPRSGLDLSAWISPPDTKEPRCSPQFLPPSPLRVLVLAVPRAAKARRPVRLYRMQQKWAEMMDRNAQPRWQCPLAGPWRGPCYAEDDFIVPPAEDHAPAVLLSEQPNGRL
jgi:hypothetical protein